MRFEVVPTLLLFAALGLVPPLGIGCAASDSDSSAVSSSAAAGAAGSSSGGGPGGAGSSVTGGASASAGMGGATQAAGGAAGTGGNGGGPGVDDDPCPPPGYPLWDCFGHCAPVAAECATSLTCLNTLHVDLTSTPIIYVRTPPAKPDPTCAQHCLGMGNASYISILPITPTADTKATVAWPWVVETKGDLTEPCDPGAPVACWGPKLVGKVHAWQFSTADKAAPARNIRLEFNPKATCP